MRRSEAPAGAAALSAGQDEPSAATKGEARAEASAKVQRRPGWAQVSAHVGPASARAAGGAGAEAGTSRHERAGRGER